MIWLISSMEAVMNLYTPGQKFIEFSFSELSHQNKGWYQQFVNSGMETYLFCIKIVKYRMCRCTGHGPVPLTLIRVPGAF